MSIPGQFRAKAKEYTDLAVSANSPESAREFQQLERSFSTLADNEQWLSEHPHQTVHASDLTDEARLALAAQGPGSAADQDQILRYLGAALILRWDTLPMKLQRELFDTAGTMGEILDTGRLRAHIARFLHKHKNDQVNG